MNKAYTHKRREHMKNILKVPAWALTVTGITLVLVEMSFIMPHQDQMFISATGSAALILLLCGSVIGSIQSHIAIKELKEKRTGAGKKGNIIKADVTYV